MILDDVLSAVDAHVAKHIFEQGILGALKGKTILFVTHQNHLLPRADHVVVIHNNRIENQGTYAALIAQGVNFDEIVKRARGEGGSSFGQITFIGDILTITVEAEQQDSESETEEEEAGDHGDKAALTSGAIGSRKLTSSSVKDRKLSRKSTRESADDKEAEKATPKAPVALVEKEERETGVVNAKIYWAYIKANGSALFLTMYARFVAPFLVLLNPFG